MELQQMEMLTKMKATKRNKCRNESHARKDGCQSKGNERGNKICTQAEMKSAVSAIEEKMEAAVHSMRTWRKEMMACQEPTEAHMECKEPT
jgi:hypothetical protein